MMKKILIIIVVAGLMTGCGGCDRQRRRASEPMTEARMARAVDEAHQSLSSTDYPGTYYAVLPFEQHGGLGVSITLGEEDYVAEQTYIATGETHRFEGTYDWDARGEVIELQGVGGEIPRRFFVGPDLLTVVDANGNIVPDSRYILPKQNTSGRP